MVVVVVVRGGGIIYIVVVGAVVGVTGVVSGVVGDVNCGVGVTDQASLLSKRSQLWQASKRSVQNLQQRLLRTNAIRTQA